jgi:dTDP-4-dehydrorhamnose 3,5-epimerase
MKFKETLIRDLWVIEPEPFYDNRGKFYRVFCKEELKEIGHTKRIVQVNNSFTKKKGTIRGMHFQFPPKAEIKIVKCIQGSIFDVAIDLRKDSPTFLKWHGEILTAENMKLMYIPEGFAHGFQTLEDNCDFLYLNTEFYSPEHEGGILYNDPKIGIEWPLKPRNISQRDKSFPNIDESFNLLKFS